MGFKKGHIPHNKSNDLIFYLDTFSYCDIIFNVNEVKKLYIEDNIQKLELSKILNIPIHKLNKIFDYYKLWKPKSLSNKNVAKNTDFKKVVENVKNTKLEKYSDENYNNREKAKQTCLDRFGEDNIFKTEKFKLNQIKLNQERYGCDYNSQAEEIKEKKKQTCLNKFGTSCPFQAEEVKEKSKQTNIKNLGVEYPTQSKVVMQKQKNTNNLKYGREYGFDYEKSKQYFLSKYGVEYFTQTLDFHKKSKKRYIYGSEIFDSFPELCVYIYAIENNISIERTPLKFAYVYKNIIHYYIPDFRYDGRLIEIKGDHFFNNGKMINPFDRTQDQLYEEKHQCGIKNNVEFWTEADYKFALDYFKFKRYRRKDYENKGR